jgi:hypothetical protein
VNVHPFDIKLVVLNAGLNVRVNPGSTVIITVYVCVSPFSAVTTTLSEFEPVRNPVFPLITRVDLSSLVVATTVTEDVP